MKPIPFIFFFFLCSFLIISACSSSKKTTDTETGSTEINSQNQTEEDRVPEIVGGIQRLMDEVEYPDEAEEQKIQGTVRLGVMVKKDGSIGEIDVIQSPHPLLSRAAKKAARKMKYKPGIQDGKYTDVYMTFPVLFRLN